MPENPPAQHVAFASHYRKRTTFAACCFITGLLLLAGALAMLYSGKFVSSWLAVGMLAIATTMVPTGFKLLWASLVGKQGEAKTLRALRGLADECIVVTNWVPTGGKGGDVDLMVVGRHGVVAVEIKRWLNPILIDGDMWRIQLERGYKKKVMSPSLQAKRNAATVYKHLAHSGMKVSVVPVVVLASRVAYDAIGPTLPILRLHELPAYVQSLPVDPKAEPERILAALQAAEAKQIEHTATEGSKVA